MQIPKQDPFTRLIADHHSGLRHYITSLGVNPAWVDDLAQDTFLIAYQKWDEFQKVENTGAWLRVVARNVVLNETAKLNRRQRLLNEKVTLLLVEAEGEDDHAEIVDPNAHSRRIATLRTCLDRLTERSRGVVEARYFNDRNSSQIGHEMDMKPAAVRKVLFRARQALADCFKQTIFNPPTSSPSPPTAGP